MHIVCRVIGALISATVYKLATNAYLQAALLLCFDWHLSLWWLSVWWALVIAAVSSGVTRKSRLPGLEQHDIFTANRMFRLLGDEQQGWLFPPDSKLPRWLLPYVCCGWRNKLRNIAFWRPLAWLHRPKGEMHGEQFWIGRVLFSVRWRGWLTELQCDYAPKRWFADIGPRLDQPDAWGGVTWAWRVGRY
jgi:hypothetical protein